MNKYELTFILVPDISDSKRDEFIEKVRGWVNDGKGEMEKIDIWGKKTLAYSIKKNSYGIYVFMALNLVPKEVQSLDRKLKLEEMVLRYLIVKKE